MIRLPRLSTISLLCLLATASAVAQDDPELGETAPAGAQRNREKPRAKKPARRAAKPEVEEAPEPPPPPPEPPPPSPMFEERAPEAPPGDESDTSAEHDTDHAAIVGHFGAGLLGAADIPLGGATYPATARAVIAPILGARYWFTDRIGLEAGVGFGFRSGNIKITGDGAGDADNDSSKAFALHLGAPISLHSGRHYNLLIVPQVLVGLSFSTITGATSPDADDVYGTAFLLEGGVRGGVEVQLGGIGLPGLALQVSAGVRLRYETTETDAPTSVTKASNLVIATSPSGAAGSVLASSIAVIYYF